MAGGAGEAAALCFHGHFTSPQGALKTTQLKVCFWKNTGKFTDVGEQHKWEQDDLMLFVPQNMFGSCQNGSTWRGRVSAASRAVTWPALVNHLTGCLPRRWRKQRTGGRCSWLILKALSCQEDLYSADRGNVFCQAFEIQMMSSTLCPTDGFESSHKSGATEMGPTRAVGEQKREISFIPKNRWQRQTEKSQIDNQKAAWIKCVKFEMYRNMVIFVLALPFLSHTTVSHLPSSKVLKKRGLKGRN